MGNSSDKAARALETIARKGQLVKWRKVTNGVLPESDKPWLPGELVVNDFDVFIAFIEVSSAEGKSSKNYSKGSNVSKGSVGGIMGANEGFKPAIKDVVIRDDVELAVVDFEKTNVDGTDIIFEIEFAQ